MSPSSVGAICAKALGQRRWGKEARQAGKSPLGHREDLGFGFVVAKHPLAGSEPERRRGAGEPRGPQKGGVAFS